MRYINLRFTYLLTYLLTYCRAVGLRHATRAFINKDNRPYTAEWFCPLIYFRSTSEIGIATLFLRLKPRHVGKCFEYQINK